MSWAAVLLAAALMVGGGPARIRGPVGTQAVSTPRRADPLAAASCFDVLAACLSAGMATASAAEAAAVLAPSALADQLTRAAHLLVLGADSERAWPRWRAASPNWPTRCASMPEPRPMPPRNGPRCSSPARSGSATCRHSSAWELSRWSPDWPVT